MTNRSNDRIPHIISKCSVCTIDDMLTDGWCDIRCSLKNLIRSKYKSKSNNIYKRNVNIKSEEFQEVLMEL
jgi:hypothetical protein